MTKENIYETWLNTPYGDFANSPSNAEHYEERDEDPKTVFDKLAPKEGLYKIIGNSPVYAGNYNLDSATDRLKFALDNTTASGPEGDICGKNILACTLRNNGIHFGGFPATGRTIPKQ